MRYLQVLVLLITATMVAINIRGILQLEQNFDPNWYLRENSYVSEYFNAMKRSFPSVGERASIYTGEHQNPVSGNTITELIDSVWNYYCLSHYNCN